MQNYQIHSNLAQWEKIYQLILSCGSIHDPRDFVITLLPGLHDLCHFDAGLVYFLDGNQKIIDYHLMNIEERWNTLYFEYNTYSKKQEYAGFTKGLREPDSKVLLGIREWDKEYASDFVLHLIRPRHLKYSCGFSLFDLSGIPRAVIALDRIQKQNFTDTELTNICLAIPQINNLYKNFYVQQQNSNANKWKFRGSSSLTPRELEIANLLCQGVSPANISNILYISRSTTYKHIAHIYEKLNVSSKQELLVKMLN